MINFPHGIQVEAVIFDFDGVIVDTEPLHYTAFQRTLEPLDLHFTWEEYVETYIGFDDRDAFRHAFLAKNLPLGQNELHALIEKKAAFFQEVIRSDVSPYPGVLDLIHHLHTHDIPLAICSGALRADIDPILAMLGISDLFDVIITADDVAASKPDPECYQLAFTRLHIIHQSRFAQERTIAIEDTPAGISAASAAGLKVCAVTNSYPASRLGQATCITESLSTLIGRSTVP
ncbi:MAG: HAD family hydrolase [Desulfuromonadaceae bacterium]|nr:HAD family hydrolase [Desulfuromonadaceae bacterium]MDD5107358.1 HAD family hydrolase [Desulfuromonadaceae bacterium]